jgi:hypothetical protein
MDSAQLAIACLHRFFSFASTDTTSENFQSPLWRLAPLRLASSNFRTWLLKRPLRPLLPLHRAVRPGDLLRVGQNGRGRRRCLLRVGASSTCASTTSATTCLPTETGVELVRVVQKLVLDVIQTKKAREASGKLPRFLSRAGNAPMHYESTLARAHRPPFRRARAGCRHKSADHRANRCATPSCANTRPALSSCLFCTALCERAWLDC